MVSIRNGDRLARAEREQREDATSVPLRNVSSHLDPARSQLHVSVGGKCQVGWRDVSDREIMAAGREGQR